MEPRDHVAYVMEQWRRELPRLDRRPMGVVGRISRLAQMLQVELERVFAEHGLNGGEFDVLAALRRSGSPYRLTPTELSRSLMVTSGGMTKRLKALGERGLIRREPDPSDARVNVVVLTPAGSRLVEEVLPHHIENETRLLAGLGVEGRAALAGLLATLAVSLGDEAGAPPARDGAGGGSQGALRGRARGARAELDGQLHRRAVALHGDVDRVAGLMCADGGGERVRVGDRPVRRWR